MPAKAGAARRPKRRGPSARRTYRIPSAEMVRSVGLEALRDRSKGSTQSVLRRAVLAALPRDSRAFALSGRRLRHLLIDAPGVHLRVRFAERPTRVPLSACPVCGGPLTAIRNHTLLGDRVVLGYRCPHCGYWTHLRRRVPVRYAFVRGRSREPAP